MFIFKYNAMAMKYSSYGYILFGVISCKLMIA